MDASHQERMHKWEQRWASAPGDDLFAKWYWQVRRYYDRRVDKEILELWRDKLGYIPIDELQAVFEDYISDPTVNKREPPEIRDIYRRWKMRKDAQDVRRRKQKAAASGKVDPAPDDENDLLRGRAIAQLSLMIAGARREPEGLPPWVATVVKAAWIEFETSNDSAQDKNAIERALERLVELFEIEAAEEASP